MVELAWELNELGFDSVVRLPPAGRPSVEIFLPPGRRPRAAMAQRGRTSVFTWERTRHRPPCDRRRRDPQTLDRPRRGRSTMRAAAERILEAVR
ncbi:hypothetical protein GCM10014719_49340 [Planomonospora parontospora subsp. antibiotica]|nr:hypothetical protein GCM10014719_49340 [Planomonospora parontospora subsp. antibiotica]GII18339.1 hypothetical protein Ppa05_50650 [Planomonospora parontospora subsp. antibiotica]